jgi:hypothetical protein
LLLLYQGADLLLPVALRRLSQEANRKQQEGGQACPVDGSSVSAM